MLTDGNMLDSAVTNWHRWTSESQTWGAAERALPFRNMPVPVGNMLAAPAGRQGTASRGGEDSLGLPPRRGRGAWFSSHSAHGPIRPS